MEHFPAALTRAESDALIDRIEAAFEARGFGLWAVEVTATGEFTGFTGLSVPAFDAPFTPAVEIGWRLRRRSWEHGYAAEAAWGVLASGFTDHGLAEVVSFTSVRNVRSQSVMRRIGMTHNPAGDFDHPRLPEGHPLRRHVLPAGPGPRAGRSGTRSAGDGQFDAGLAERWVAGGDHDRAGLTRPGAYERPAHAARRRRR